MGQALNRYLEKIAEMTEEIQPETPPEIEAVKNRLKLKVITGLAGVGLGIAGGFATGKLSLKNPVGSAKIAKDRLKNLL